MRNTQHAARDVINTPPVVAVAVRCVGAELVVNTFLNFAVAAWGVSAELVAVAAVVVTTVALVMVWMQGRRAASWEECTRDIRTKIILRHICLERAVRGTTNIRAARTRSFRTRITLHQTCLGDTPLQMVVVMVTTAGLLMEKAGMVKPLSKTMEVSALGSTKRLLQ